MTEQDALLQAILDDPTDDMPRLVYADWLDDNAGHAGAARAEFIRVQIELALHPRDQARFALSQRQMALWGTHGHLWEQDVPAALRNGLTYRRGFIDEFRGTARAFFQSNPALFWCMAPAQILELTGASPEQLDRLIQSPPLARLNRLEFTSAQMPTATLEALLACPFLTRLTALGLARQDLDLNAVNILTASPLLPRLRFLALRTADLTDEAVTRLAESPHLAGLQDLDLSDNRIGNDGALALSRSPHLETLRSLALGRNFIDEESLNALRRRFGKRLQTGRQVT